MYGLDKAGSRFLQHRSEELIVVLIDEQELDAGYSGQVLGKSHDGGYPGKTSAQDNNTL